VWTGHVHVIAVPDKMPTIRAVTNWVVSPGPGVKTEHASMQASGPANAMPCRPHQPD